MNKNQSFNALIDLVELDALIQSKKEVLQRIVKDQQHLISQKQSLEKSLFDLKHAVLLAKNQVDTVEFAMKELDEQEKNKKILISKLTDYKEYKSLQAEIDFIHEDQRKHEQTIIDAWDAFDVAEARYLQQLPIVQEKIEKIEIELEACEQKRLLVEQEMNMQKEERPAKQVLVPQEWMEKYLLMQSRVKNPVVAIEVGACAACFYHLTPTDMQAAKRGALIQCKSCFRLLYLPGVMDIG